VEIYSGKVDVSSTSTRNSVSAGQGVILDSSGVMSAPQSLPPAPVLVKQEVTSDGEKHQGASWKQVSGALSFRVEVAADSNFEKPIYFAGYAGDTIDFNFLASYPSGRYYIRLMSVNQKGLRSVPSNALPYTSPVR
jgi:hypothetical protein